MRTFLVLRTIEVLTILEKQKPRTTRVQKNPTSGQWTIGIPVEVAEAAELEPKDTVRFTVESPGRILLEVLR